MVQIEDHPSRYALANELHARPFPSLAAPAHAAFLALKRQGVNGAQDRAEDLAHLIQLLDRFGAPHPQPDATHYFGDLGPFRLKWESHTEFVTYTAFVGGVADRPFDKAAMDVFPQDWLADAPGLRITSALVRIEEMPTEQELAERFASWFVSESLVVSHVLDAAAVIAGDFRIDAGGNTRFAVFVDPATGPRRVGRIVQRICEIETYKTMSMLGLERARRMGGRLAQIEAALEELTGDMASQATAADETLSALLAIASELESLLAQSSFRFSATRAYEAIVVQRVEVLREARFEGRQTIREFMMRRFDPAMRTVAATEARLNAMSSRAARAGDLLRTRVDVERSAQNQELLASMDRRADTQLRLQRTVEGLSVVAISYYAVNLASYALYPLAASAGLSKPMTTAALTPAVILAVFLLVRRIRRAMK
ncbi:hypothetical protein AIOL_001306 [Candidatus Rhodobacter oscarellae]|uniref:Membrane-anchored protein n=1 Tax=Candidatus Rhodobacter oscarellae TaxID=1675527 RepID=A0A0J9E3F3_9RHOB|nr:DUF3422 domain-containing protein [Candidatus Rhodobacter lobularis]KMW56354.1 hypothetical protein AIOL_001306 [Candidatus Rhodobacter lobularis]